MPRVGNIGLGDHVKTCTCSRAESINCRISDSTRRPPETDGALVGFFTFCRFALLILITWLFYVDAYPFLRRCCGRRIKFAALPRTKLRIPWGVRGADYTIDLRGRCSSDKASHPWL